MQAFGIETGNPYDLGATFDGKGTNFALYSAHAEKVDLCLYDASGKTETHRITLPEITNHVWHGYIQGIKPGQLYGYRVYGPYDPLNGHRFNHHKLLLDPYAREIGGTFRWHNSHFGYQPGHPMGDLSFNTEDNSANMVKARVVEPWATVPMESRPNTSLQDTIIYEAHPKGLTMTHPKVRDYLRGTIKGLSDPAIINHLKDLGITALELLPVHAYFNDKRLEDLNLRNYWGYNPLSYFAPAPHLLSSGKAAEFRESVKTLHEAGLEVIIDVVYNHTFEGNRFGPTLSFRGIDNATYYRLRSDRPDKYVDYTGCGNTVDIENPTTLRMVMDSLRYWVSEMGVDGFRFDLAVALGRNNGIFSPESPFFKAIAQDPILSRVKMIAEPWDLGPQGYQVGNFPVGWSEWNGKFRDDIRTYWQGQPKNTSDLAVRMAGSSPEFGNRMPANSINFVTAHDGFTLRDLVSYERKYNEANGENNIDGDNHNNSRNYGVEGETDDPRINALRRRQQFNMLASLILAQGTPMILSGDEINNTQGGNNNAYCQDNETGWLNWDKADHDLAGFVKMVIALRKEMPLLRNKWHLHGFDECAHGIKDIEWLTPSGEAPDVSYWNDLKEKALGLMFNGAASGKGQDKKGHSRLLLVFNAAGRAKDFQLPDLPGGNPLWEQVIGRDQKDLKEHRSGSNYSAPPHSLSAFIQHPL